MYRPDSYSTNTTIGCLIVAFKIGSHCEQFIFVQHAILDFQTIHPGKTTKTSMYKKKRLLHILQILCRLFTQDLFKKFESSPISYSFWWFLFCSLSLSRTQIFFHGKDMKSLHKHLSPECLPTYYGGKIDIPLGTGAALSDLFRLYGKEFESKLINPPDTIKLPIFRPQQLQWNVILTPNLSLYFSLYFLSPITVANSFGYDSSKNRM